IYRLGWYGGLGGRKMTWLDGKNGAVTQVTLGSVKQRIPGVGANQAIDCLAPPDPLWPGDSTKWHPWPCSYSLNVPDDWVSGVYLARLTTIPTSGSGKQSFSIFVVREDGRSSDLYVQSSVATYETYNPWGGMAIYDWPSHPPTWPTSFASL